LKPGDKDPKAAQRAYEARMVRSTAHPIRATALSMMAERPTSPKEVAAAVGKPIGNVSYHISELVKAQMAVLVDEKKRGGATEHFYASTTIDDQASSRLDARQRTILVRNSLHSIVADAAWAVEAGVFGSRPDTHLARVPLRLDQEGWDEIRDLYTATLETTMAIAARSADRLEEGGSAGFKAMAVTMLFEMPPESDAPEAHRTA
jgi:DNA-binding transcriptional ArsR family regulator